jgi:catechol 2,3-dioxygenase-like lactoylglutathione lyase family enzyme
MKAQGIGAVMIFARNAERLSLWYAAHLGIITELDESDGNFYGSIADENEVCSVRFGIYPCEPDVQHASSSVMINYKVRNLDQCKGDLLRKGVVVDSELESSGLRFLYLRDPEGNRIELWETQPALVPETTKQTSNLEEDRTSAVS